MVDMYGIFDYPMKTECLHYRLPSYRFHLLKKLLGQARTVFCSKVSKLYYGGVWLCASLGGGAGSFLQSSVMKKIKVEY